MFFNLKGPAAIGLDARGKRIYAVCFDARDVFWPSLNDQRRFVQDPAWNSAWSLARSG